MPAMRLLASDMDGTLLPLDPQADRSEATARFRDLLAARDSGPALAYITGRSLTLALAGVAERDLPAPDYLVGDVGTSLYIRNGAEWTIEPVYKERLAESWGGRGREEIAELLRDFDGLEAQEPDRQNTFKQSYYLPLAVDPAPLRDSLGRRLAEEGIRANLVYSVDRVRRVGLLDVLPAGAAKHSALFRLQEMLGIAPEETVYAGDSGNDLQAFTSGCRAILVGNTPDWVCREVEKAVDEAGIPEDRIFHAPGNDIIGVLEGCSHFGIL